MAIDCNRNHVLEARSHGMARTGTFRTTHSRSTTAAAHALAPEAGAASVHVSFYEYVGRVGPTAMMLAPNTDLITEGEQNRFMRKEPAREWFDEFVSSVGGPIKGVTSIELGGRASLSVEEVGGEPALHLDGAVIDTQHHHGVAPGGHGSYAGSFEGELSGRSYGVHVGDVVGNVVGTVSSLENHKVIRATLLGDGQGVWTGNVSGAMCGSFEGEARVSSGSIESISHLGVGGPAEPGVGLTVRESGDGVHVRLVNGGESTDISCDADGTLRTQRMSAAGIRCDGELVARGVDNQHHGMINVGNVTGVNYMHVKHLEVDRLQRSAGEKCRRAVHVLAGRVARSPSKCESMTSRWARWGALASARPSGCRAPVETASPSTSAARQRKAAVHGVPPSTHRENVGLWWDRGCYAS